MSSCQLKKGVLLSLIRSPVSISCTSTYPNVIQCVLWLYKSIHRLNQLKGTLFVRYPVYNVLYSTVPTNSP